MVEKNLYQAIIKRRSIRLFKQKRVPLEVIKKVLNCARVAPSAANLQFLEYLVVNDKTIAEKIFPHLHWAAYITPLRNPAKDQQPDFYIAILINKARTKEPNLRDVGTAAENILLSLTYFGLGGSLLQNIDRAQIKNILCIPDKYEIDSIIAVGYPAEEPLLETDSVNVKYWLDVKNRLHVPKRPLKDIIHKNKIGTTNAGI
jgi:nitroreductase